MSAELQQPGIEPASPQPLQTPQGDPKSLDVAGLVMPKLDVVPMKTLELLVDQEFSMQAFAAVAALDPAVSDQIIRLASSPLYGASQKFADLKKAVVYLGLRTALSITLGFSMFKCMRRGEGTREEQWCWRRILINAVAARELAKITKVCPIDSAFYTAMAQDFGLLLLMQQRREQHGELIVAFRREPEPFSELERRLFGRTHATVSEQILRHWKFPEESVAAVARHHDEDLDCAEKRTLAEVLAVSEFVSDFLLAPHIYTYRWLEAGWLLLFDDDAPNLEGFLKVVAIGVAGLSDILSVHFPEGLRVDGLIDWVFSQEEQKARNPSP